MEGARSRQGLGAGPITDTLGRPSQGVLENRTAAEARQNRQSVRTHGRKAVLAVHNAKMHLLIASQRAAQRAAVFSIDAALSSRHASAIAIVVARFADRRSTLASMSDTERGAALRQLASDEAHELARLALDHASEKRALRKATLGSMLVADRAARRSLRVRNRHQRIVVAIQQHRIWRREPTSSRRKAHAQYRERKSPRTKSFRWRGNLTALTLLVRNRVPAPMLNCRLLASVRHGRRYECTSTA